MLKVAKLNNAKLTIPDFQYCTDNAAMIGSAAYFNLVNGKISDLNLNAKPNLKL